MNFWKQLFGRREQPATENAGTAATTPTGNRLIALQTWIFRDYMQTAVKPWPSLVLILPLIITAEYARIAAGGNGQLSAPAWRMAKHALGVILGTQTATVALPLAVVAVLLAWHQAARDSWRFRVTALPLMMLEAIVLAVPLTIMASQLSWSNGEPSVWTLSPGDICANAVYGEFVFRLVVLGVLSIIFGDLLRLPKVLALILAVVSASVACVMLEGWPGPDQSWPTLYGRFLKAIYFSQLFLLRGFGIAVVTHAAYLVLLVLIARL